MTADEPQKPDQEPEQPDLEDAEYDALAPEGMPPIDFNIFVLSLNTSALIHLGEAPGADGRLQLNLPMARQTIDMLAILERKTRSNLTGEEERILHQVLFDLRMRYMRRCKG